MRWRKSGPGGSLIVAESPKVADYDMAWPMNPLAPRSPVNGRGGRRRLEILLLCRAAGLCDLAFKIDLISRFL